MLKNYIFIHFLSFRDNAQAHMVTGNFATTGSSHEITSLSPGTQYTIRVEGGSTQVTEQMYATSKETRCTRSSYLFN